MEAERGIRTSRRYNVVAYDDYAGVTYRAATPPMTVAQLVRHMAERLCCPHVTVTVRRGRVAMLAARWPGGLRRGIVATYRKGH